MKRRPTPPLSTAQRELAADSLALAYHQVKLLWPAVRMRLCPEEALSLAMLALCRAAATFDASRGWQFSTYACISIRRALLCTPAEGLIRQPERSRWRPPAVLYAEEFGAGTFGSERQPWQPESQEPDPAEQAHARGLPGLLASLLDRLPARDRAVVSGKYLADQTFRQIARQMGVTPVRVQQIHNRAMRRLRALAASLRAEEVLP